MSGEDYGVSRESIEKEMRQLEALLEHVYANDQSPGTPCSGCGKVHGYAFGEKIPGIVAMAKYLVGQWKEEPSLHEQAVNCLFDDKSFGISFWAEELAHLPEPLNLLVRAMASQRMLTILYISFLYGFWMGVDAVRRDIPFPGSGQPEGPEIGGKAEDA